MKEIKEDVKMEIKEKGIKEFGKEWTENVQNLYKKGKQSV